MPELNIKQGQARKQFEITTYVEQWGRDEWVINNRCVWTLLISYQGA